VNRVALRVTDMDGLTDVDEVLVTVVDTTAPFLGCPGSAVAECTGPAGADVSVVATASDVCSPAVELTNDRTGIGGDASGLYALGTDFVTFTAGDESGNTATCRSSVTVRDTAAPTMSLTVEPAMLWPPNHRMVEVDALVVASDVCSTTTPILESVSSDEPDDGEGMGDGDTVADIQGAAPGTADFQFQLRAERAGTGGGRTYTVTYRATDGSGNVATATALAFVPHNVDGLTEPLPIVAVENGAGTFVAWNEVPGALIYNVVRGEVGSLRDNRGFFHLGQLTCMAPATTRTNTEGAEDTELPAPGEAFFYLVESNDGLSSGYGTESAAKDRFAPPRQGACATP